MYKGQRIVARNPNLFNRGKASQVLKQMYMWITATFHIFLVFSLLSSTNARISAISELSNCERDQAFDRAVNDNVSPWTVHLYHCRNMDPDNFWSVECRRGSCINPTTMKPLENYTIMPIKRRKTYRNRINETKGRVSVTIACKCVPNILVDGNNLYA